MTIKDIMPWRRKEKTEALARREDVSDVFTGLQREMNRMFEGLFSDFEIGMVRPDDTYLPRVDVKETDSTVEVAAELPGLDEKDIEVTLDDDGLILKGEKREEKEERVKGWHRVERTYGSFHRRIPLPAEVDGEKVEAVFTKGVLNVKLPKTKVSKARNVTVKTK